MHVFDRLAMISLLAYLVVHQVGFFSVQMESLLDTFLGWLAAPLTYLLPSLAVPCAEGLQSWLGGFGVARFGGLGFLLLFVFVFGQFLGQCALLVTRLGLMPCSAWSKKNVSEGTGPH